MNGHWRNPNFPKTGWVLSHIIDLGEPSDICEMCKVQEIRYVHFIDHMTTHDRLHVGCICGGKLTGEIDRHKSLEGRLRKKAAQKGHWPGLKSWKISQNGNPWIKKDGILVVLFNSGGDWSYAVDSVKSNKWFDSQHEAAGASFEDYWLKVYPIDRLPKPPEPVFRFNTAKFALPKGV